MTLTKPVVVPFEGPLTKGNFVRRTDRFTAHLVLDGIEVSDESNGEVKAHCINPGRMEAFVDPGATIWARRAPENGPKRKTDWTWELIERDGVLCSTNTQRPNALIAAVLKAKALTGFTDYKSVKAEHVLPHEGPGTKSRCDFFVEEKDGTHHYVEVKNCHATYPDEDLLRGWGYFPDSVSERAARHCRELAALASKPKTKCTVIIVASRADATKGIRPSDYHDPGFCAAAREAQKAGVVFRGLRASHTTDATTIEDEIPVDLSTPSADVLCALHRAWAACAPITGWDRTFGKDAPKRVANGPFAHNKGRAGCDSALAPITSEHFTPTVSRHFDDRTPVPKRRRKRAAKKK